MKHILLILLMLPTMIYSQYLKTATHYDSESAVEHIIHGDLMRYLEDEVEFRVEKRNGDLKSCRKTSDQVNKEVSKAFKKGLLEQGCRTNGGYTFQIVILDEVDDVAVVGSVSFEVNHATQLINQVTIYRE